MPGVSSGTASYVSGFTIIAETLGTGRPTEPSFISIVALFERLGGTFTDTSGDNSVVPYPSTGRIPNFFSKASQSGMGSFSAPATTTSSELNSSGSHRRRYVRRNVGVASSKVALRIRANLATVRVSNGEKWYAARTSSSSGPQSVIVKPSE